MRLLDYFKMILNTRPILSVLLACLLAGIAIGARPTYHAFKGWRSDRLIAKSQISLEKESYTEAFYQAHTATLLDNDEESARNFAQIALQVGYPLSNKLWKGLVESPFVRTSDWQQAVESSVRLGDNGQAFDYLIKWKRRGIEDEVAYKASTATALFANGQIPEARAISLELINESSIDRKTANLCSQLINRFGNEADQETLNDRLKFWSQKNSELGKFALQLIVASPNLSESERKSAAKGMIEHPVSNLEERLGMMAFQVQEGWIPLEELEHYYETSVSISEGDYLPQYSTFLCDLERYDRVVELIDPNTMGDNRILLRNWLVAKIGVGEGSEVLKATGTSEDRKTSIAEESLLRALAYKQSGDEDRFRANLFESVTKASDNDIAFLESHFLKLGETEALMELYLQLSKNPAIGQQARLALLELSLAQKNENMIRVALDGMMHYSAERQSSLLARVTYLRLIMGLELENSRSDAEELVSFHPQDFNYRLLLAFAHLRSANFPTARKLTELSNSTNDPTDSRQALLLAILNSSFNDMDKAKALAQAVNPDELLPSEIALLNEIQG